MGPASKTRSKKTPLTEAQIAEWRLVDKPLVESDAALAGLQNCAIKWMPPKERKSKRAFIVIIDQGQQLFTGRVLNRVAEEHIDRNPRPSRNSPAALDILWYDSLTPESQSNFMPDKPEEDVRLAGE